MESWKGRGRGGGATNLDGTPSAAGSEGDSGLPQGPGEWADPLGLPLCVVCQNVSFFIIADISYTNKNRRKEWKSWKRLMAGKNQTSIQSSNISEQPSYGVRPPFSASFPNIFAD